MKHYRRTAISLAAAQAALLSTGLAWGQAATPPVAAASAPAEKAQSLETVVVSGQRAALQSAQKIKQNADEVVDSIVADDIGKLPDKSVSEVLQRIVGVSIDRSMGSIRSLNDGVEKFSIEGSGVSIRGLSLVRSETNGRESFSANGGRAISFEDVPPELMAGVDIYKNPSAEQTEGGIGGLVNLRTWKPFDFAGFKAAASFSVEQSSLRSKTGPSFSGLLSNRWHTDFGEFGALIDYSHSLTRNRTDGFRVEPYMPRDDALIGDTSKTTYWVPGGLSWRSSNYDRTRDGVYAALQWRKGDLESSLSYFESRYNMQWIENASYFYGDKWATTIDPGATFGSNGALLTGVLHGVNLGTDARFSSNTSKTRDLSWNVTWKPTSNLQVTGDLQLIKASFDGLDNTLGLKTEALPKQTVDLRGSVPRISFDQSDRDFLADPKNYYWNFTQDHRELNTADMKTVRADAKYKFKDNAVLRDLRFGVRLTDREAVSRQTDGGYHWAVITDSWLAPGGKKASLGDPRFAQDFELHKYNNFFNGAAEMPAAVLAPTMDMVHNVPQSFQKVHGYRDALCRDNNPVPADAQNCINGFSWISPNSTFGTPQWTNPQSEKTQAAYGQLRFDLDEYWHMPVEGNVGVRLVHTSVGAVGRLIFNPKPTPGAPAFDKIDSNADIDYKSSYTNVLPSLNLLYHANDKLQFRAAASRGMTRPDFYQLQGYITLNQNIPANYPNSVEGITYTGDGSKSNPFLKPTTSNNFDLSAEYYFSKTGSLTLALFNKQLRDIVVGQTSQYRLKDTAGTEHAFTITSPTNGAKGYARGLEVGFQRYFDMLPGWLSGFGVQANYTYITSKQKLYSPLSMAAYCSGLDSTTAAISLSLNGCDTDARTFKDLPLQNLSRNAYNLALLYDYGPLSARLAYSWRGKYLQAANAYGTNGGGGLDTNPDSSSKGQKNVNWALPTWGGAYGQVDLGVFYKLNDKLTIGVEAQNLNDATYTQQMQQHIGMMTRATWSSGRRYSTRLNIAF